jgi:hypothetical protein
MPVTGQISIKESKRVSLQPVILFAILDGLSGIRTSLNSSNKCKPTCILQ